MNENSNGKNYKLASSYTDQVYIGLTTPKVQQQPKYGYIYTRAFVIVQLNNGMWIRKNI